MAPTLNRSVRIGFNPLPYVLPGSVGFLGNPSTDLTHYAPPGSGLPGDGVAPAGCAWQSYGLRCDGPYPLVLDHVYIHGGLYLTDDAPVMLQATNSIIEAGTGDELSPIQLAEGTGTGDVQLTDCTFRWIEGTNTNGEDIGATLFIGNQTLHANRCDVSGMPQAFDPPSNGSAVTNCWLHDLIQNNTDPLNPSHIDVIFCQGGTGTLLIQGNYVDGPMSGAVNSAVFLQSVPASPIEGITIDKNFLNGCNFGVRNENGDNIVVTNNVFGTFLVGDAILISPATIGTWTNNKHASDGSTVTQPT